MQYATDTPASGFKTSPTEVSGLRSVSRLPMTIDAGKTIRHERIEDLTGRVVGFIQTTATTAQSTNGHRAAISVLTLSADGAGAVGRDLDWLVHRDALNRAYKQSLQRLMDAAADKAAVGLSIERLSFKGGQLLRVAGLPVQSPYGDRALWSQCDLLLNDQGQVLGAVESRYDCKAGDRPGAEAAVFTHSAGLRHCLPKVEGHWLQVLHRGGELPSVVIPGWRDLLRRLESQDSVRVAPDVAAEVPRQRCAG